MAAAPNTRPAPQVVERLAGASGRPGTMARMVPGPGGRAALTA